MVDLSKLMQAIILAIVMLGTGIVADAEETRSSRDYEFTVYLDGKRIGTHVVDIMQQDNGKRVDIEADFDVKILFMSVYRYRHSNREVWDGACLDRVDASTDANGEQFFIKSKNTEFGMRLITHDGAGDLEGCVRSFAYWDVNLLNSDKLLNTQTGEYVDVELKVIGDEILTIDGATHPATKYRLQTENEVIDLWYGPEGRWIALESETQNGMTIRYEAKLETTNATASL